LKNVHSPHRVSNPRSSGLYVEPQPLRYSVTLCFLQTNRTGSKISCPLSAGYSALQSAETWVPWELAERAICPSDPHLTLSRNSLVIVIFSCK
jgi:hypothetical protein